MSFDTLAKNLKDKTWRLRNLYFIINKDGQRVKFKPNSAQVVLENDPHPRKVIPKARQRGITTFKCIDKFDNALFKANYEGDIIADTSDNAKKIFKKIKYAWEHLAQTLRDQYIVHTNNETTLTISLKNTPEEKRTVRVVITTRSSTSQDLHISELGRIGAKFPEREREIKAGALESVGANQSITVESTAMGKQGLFWNLVQQGIDNQTKEKLSPLDWKLYFFPWYEQEEYRDPIPCEIPDYLVKYFEEIEKMGVKLEPEQKYWYVRKEKTQGFDMKSEYPSFLLEAFEGQTEGTVYLNELNKMIKEGRYSDFGYVEGIPVFTIWDLGWSDTMAIIFVQNVMGQLKIIDYYENSRQPYHHYAKIIQDKPYVYGGHFLPHDASNHNLLNGKTALENIKALGLRNVKQIERGSIEGGIREVRKTFDLIWISKRANIFNKNENGMLEKINLYDRLNSYRYEWNDKLNEYSKEPLHDINSHGADTLRGLVACINKISNTFIKANTVNRGFGGVKPLNDKLGII